MNERDGSFKKHVALLGWCLLASCGLSTACSHAVGSGTRVTESRAVWAFDRIAVSGTMDMTIRVGDARGVRLSGDHNIVAAIETSVRDDVLMIRVPKGTIQDERVTVTVTTPRLKQIHAAITENVTVKVDGEPLEELEVSLSGVGKLAVGYVVADKVIARVRGAGKLDLSGTIDELDFAMSGLGKGSLESLCAQTATVRVNGVGKVTVNARETLKATVAGLGKVTYLGTPELTPVVKGGGRVESDNETQNTCLPPV